MARTPVKHEPVEDSDDFAPSTFNFARHNTRNDMNINKATAVPSTQRSMPSSGSTVRNDDEDIPMTNGTSRVSSTPQDTPSAFAQTPRKLIKTIQKLESLGIDATLPSLPKIVVVGDQSHGKSSVIEAVCGISLPRDVGTCTRCPFEIVTTSQSEAWSCEVSLIFSHKYSRQGQTIRWTRADSQENVTFARVHQGAELEAVLRLAQTAILNPSIDPRTILRSNNPHLPTEISFAPNIIRLDISSPELPELALYDLPGAITVTEQEEDQHLVNFVEKLITNYVREENTIVLLTTAANADIENCKTFNIIRRQAAAKRCIGVITKPDLMDSTEKSRDRVQKMLSGETWVLGHGWFVSKQLSQAEMEAGNVTRGRAQELERQMFSCEPWSSLPHQERFGIKNLQAALSQKLTEHILGQLPEIYARVEGKLNEVDSALASFPPEPAAPCMEVLTELDCVSKALSDELRGGPVNNTFRDKYKEVVKKQLLANFKKAQPQLQANSPEYTPLPISLESDDSDDDTPQSTSTPSSAKSRKGNNGKALPMRGTPSAAVTPSSAIKREGGLPAMTEQSKVVFNIKQVKDAYESGNNGGLDGLSLDVTNHLSLQCLRGAPGIVDKALESVHGLLVTTLADIIQTTLARRRGTELFKATTQIIEELFLDLSDREKATITDHLACEAYKPFATDGKNFENKKEAKKADLVKLRTYRRCDEYFDTIEARGGKITSREDRMRKAEDQKWVSDKLGPDPHAAIVAEMAGCFAYYDLAACRIIDLVKMRLEYGLLRALEQGVRSKLLEGLHVSDTAYCAKLLAADPKREEKRRELQVEKEKLRLALEELQECRLAI